MIADRHISWFLALAIVAAFVSPGRAGDAEIDKKSRERIDQEMALVPSLYAKYQARAKLKALPKFLAKTLADYSIDSEQTVDKERELYKSDRQKYAKRLPLRAAIFDAAEALELAKKLEIRMVIFRPITPMKKTLFMKEQESQGMVIFKLEQVYAHMQEAAKQRKKETKRWQANFDFALARMESNLIFLMEHDYALGRIRADALPDLGEGDDGWRLTLVSKITISEKKTKDLAKAMKNRWERIQTDNPETPWAYFAQGEGERLIGMEWTAKKK
jgi:hypothetical protein